MSCWFNFTYVIKFVYLTGPSRALQSMWEHPLTAFGHCNLKNNKVQAHLLPDEIPAFASTVLVFVHVEIGRNGSQDSSGILQVYVEQGERKHAVYVATHHSENTWLPMTSTRVVYSQYTGAPAEGSFICWLYAAGYIN